MRAEDTYVQNKKTSLIAEMALQVLKGGDTAISSLNSYPTFRNFTTGLI